MEPTSSMEHDKLKKTQRKAAHEAAGEESVSSGSLQLVQAENSLEQAINASDKLRAQSDFQQKIQKATSSTITHQIPIQRIQVLHREYMFDLGPSGPEEARFMSDPAAYVQQWFNEEILDPIYLELTQRFPDYEQKVGEFMNGIMGLLGAYENLNTVIQVVEQRKARFIDESGYRYPIWMEALGLRGAQLEAVVDLFKYLVERKGEALNQIRITSSGGAVVTFIIGGKQYVVQHYISSDSYATVKQQVNTHMPSMNDRATGIAQILDFWDDHQAVTVEKVRTVTSTDEDKQEEIRKDIADNAYQIYNDLVEAILKLAQKGLSQGDVRLDNVGQKMYGPGRYVLFDFNQLRGATRGTVREDIEMLQKSFVHRRVDVPPLSARNQELLKKMME